MSEKRGEWIGKAPPKHKCQTPQLSYYQQEERVNHIWRCTCSQEWILICTEPERAWGNSAEYEFRKYKP